MTVFVVMSRNQNPALEQAIDRTYPGGKACRFGPFTWFVSDNRTAKAVSESLGVKKGGITGVVVMPTTGSYYGVTNTSIWDWLRSAFEASDDG